MSPAHNSDKQNELAAMIPANETTMQCEIQPSYDAKKAYFIFLIIPLTFLFLSAIYLEFIFLEAGWLHFRWDLREYIKIFPNFCNKSLSWYILVSDFLQPHFIGD